jgi:hypothetical protein
MKLKAIRQCEWPTGLHWSAGQVRDIEVPEGATVPPFYLVKVKASKKAKPAKEG